MERLGDTIKKWGGKASASFSSSSSSGTAAIALSLEALLVSSVFCGAAELLMLGAMAASLSWPA